MNAGCLAENYYDFIGNLLIAAQYHNYDNGFEPILQEDLSIIDTFMNCFNSAAFDYLEDEEQIDSYRSAH